MEGFGSSDVASYSYGSVEDGYIRNPTFEQRLRKQYWKTKQTVRSKLKKDEDEFVVAGDADIDAKLEKAHHLETSCHNLLQALANCSFFTQALSNDENILSGYLINNGENDFTHAGEVMKRVGKVYDTNSKLRLRSVEPLQRLQQEFITFSNTAIGDLSESIKRLEKSRTDYRAALLWMRNVSQKFNNPDASEQLAKYRQAQAAVKEAKSYFEKMKVNLMEKINMVAASRCNLLSHTLPYYQTELLTYLDQSADELHKLLVILRSQTQHQYKINYLLDEIRGLEVDEELPFSNDYTEGNTNTNIDKNNDSLFGLLQQELSSSVNKEETLKDVPKDDPNLPKEPSPQHDLLNDLISTDLPKEPSPQQHDLLNDLISTDLPKEPSPQQHDLLTEEWDQYSSLDTKDQPSELTDSNWADDLVLAEQPTSNNELNLEIEKLLALDEVKKSPLQSSVPDDVIFDPLLVQQDNQKNAVTPTGSTAPPTGSTAPPTGSTLLPIGPQKESFILSTGNSASFAGSSIPPTGSPLPLTGSSIPLTGSSLPLTGSSIPPTGSPLPLTGSSIPPTGSSIPPTGSSMSAHSKTGRGSSGYKPIVNEFKKSTSEQSPGQKWANLFAHLDPIANEKA